MTLIVDSKFWCMRWVCVSTSFFDLPSLAPSKFFAMVLLGWLFLFLRRAWGTWLVDGDIWSVHLGAC